MLLFLFILRMLNIVLVQTWFVPDEYWQSLEVAHNLVFNYGYLTWEWNEGMRSYIHPFLFAGFYYVVKMIGFLDFPAVIIYGPRVIQATLSVVAEWCFYRFVRKHFDSNVAFWSLFSLSTSWFWWFCATRTLINSLEADLVCFSLYFFPWHEPNFGKKFKVFLGICCVTICIRPTSLTLWIPMCLTFMYQFFCRYDMWKTGIMLFKTAIIFAFIFLATLIIDCCCYGKLVSIHYNFLFFNVLQDKGTFYGSHPWHWYLSQGIPTIVGTHLPLMFHGAVNCLKVYRSSKRQRQLVFLVYFLIGVTVLVYSVPGHKEFRFLLSIFPLFMLFSGFSLSYLSENQRNCAIVWLLLTNVAAMLYTGLCHQLAPLKVIDHLRNQFNKDNKVFSSENQVLFLLPCHSTPYYSHVHNNVSMRFLTCEPNLTAQGPNYVDEADQFFANPMNWITKYLFRSSKHNLPVVCESFLPSFIVLYDRLEKQIGHALSTCYYISHRSFHTHFPEGRVGRYMLVLSKKN